MSAQPEPYSDGQLLNLQPLTPSIGAELKGADLSRDLSDDLMREIEQASTTLFRITGLSVA